MEYGVKNYHCDTSLLSTLAGPNQTSCPMSDESMRRRDALAEAHIMSLKYTLYLGRVDDDSIADFQIGTCGGFTSFLVRRGIAENDLDGLFVCGLDGDSF